MDIVDTQQMTLVTFPTGQSRPILDIQSTVTEKKHLTGEQGDSCI